MSKYLDIINEGCTSVSGGIIAAEIAVLYESEGYSDWYLPSKELSGCTIQ